MGAYVNYALLLVLSFIHILDRRSMTKEPINIAGMLIPQKVYRLHGFHKYLILSISLLCLFMVAATTTEIIWVLASGWRGGVWLEVVIIAICSSLIIFAVWFFYRVWSQRLEFSSEGITFTSLFFCIYAPWENIEAFDKDARAPIGSGSYGAFVYKKPALLYVPIRKGKEKNLTVVQIPRSRARTNPDLILYLAHCLPLMPEVFPREELATLLSTVTSKNG